jgi:hypothetical protein
LRDFELEKKSFQAQKFKIENGGLIQDGDFFFFLNFRHFNFVAWQNRIYFIIALELQHIKKGEHFIQRLCHNKILKFFEKYHLSY